MATPPNSGAAWAGPYASQSAILRFTGALSGNCIITLPRAGFWIVENLTSGAFVVKLASSAPGNVICAPPGEAVHIYCDGTDVRYVDLGRIGSPLMLTASAVPAWITNCTVPPFLLADGSTFSAVTYPVLNGLLGGNTLPDLRGRGWFNLNQGTGRITSAASGIDGNTLKAAGGAETVTLTQPNLPNVTLTGNFTATVNVYQTPYDQYQVGSGNFFSYINAPNGQTPAPVNFTGQSVPLGGSNTPINKMPPTTIAGITLIRAG